MISLTQAARALTTITLNHRSTLLLVLASAGLSLGVATAPSSAQEPETPSPFDDPIPDSVAIGAPDAEAETDHTTQLDAPPPLTEQFSIAENAMQRIRRGDAELVVGLRQVASDHIKTLVNNQPHTFYAGSYLDQKLEDLRCRLLVQEFDWEATQRHAVFLLECD